MLGRVGRERGRDCLLSMCELTSLDDWRIGFLEDGDKAYHQGTDLDDT